jgi:hypothetical protein
MEEPEVPTEHLQEELEEKTKGNNGWERLCALTAALLATLAAISALEAGGLANEALAHQIKATNAWSHYQAKSVRASILNTKTDILEALGKTPKAEDIEKRKQYQEEEKEIMDDAKEQSEKAEKKLEKHESFAHALTFFQIGIAICAIAVLTRRKAFWIGSLGLTGIGVAFFVQGMLH